MNTVFVDTAHWIAVFNPKDDLHEKAVTEQGRLEKDRRFVTTDFVLAEFLNAFSGRGFHLRGTACITANRILGDPNCLVLHYEDRHAIDEAVVLVQPLPV